MRHNHLCFGHCLPEKFDSVLFDSVSSTSYLIPPSKRSSMLEPIGIVLSHQFRGMLGQALNYAYM